MLAMQAFAVMFMKQRLPPRKSGPMVEWPAFSEWPYTLFAIGTYLLRWSVCFTLDSISIVGPYLTVMLDVSSMALFMVN